MILLSLLGVVVDELPDVGLDELDLGADLPDGRGRRWQRAGIRQQIVTGLQARADAADLITWDVSVTAG